MLLENHTESQTQRMAGGERRSTTATCKLRLVGTDVCDTHAPGHTHGGPPPGRRQAPRRARAAAPLTMNAAGLRGARPAAPCPSERAGAPGRASGGGCGGSGGSGAGGGGRPLNRAQMPRRRSACSGSARQAWLARTLGGGEGRPLLPEVLGFDWPAARGGRGALSTSERGGGIPPPVTLGRPECSH